MAKGRIHILGICGTFMGGVALIAKQAGYEVSGADENVYPPMSDVLDNAGISIMQGYHLDNIPSDVDCVVVGNVMSRGIDVIEQMLDQGVAYTSGPQWLYENVLRDKWVLAVAGTHGKTTTSSLLAWMLEHAGLQPGFLIGGVNQHFDVSARLGESEFFVIEADEYDTAFFDKRSKFVHYHPNTLILNNLEFDHADIFDDLAQIQTQFHHLLRIVPRTGRVIYNQHDDHLQAVIERGLWSDLQSFSDGSIAADWQATAMPASPMQWQLSNNGDNACAVKWSMLGRHNQMNAAAAVAAANHVGVSVEDAVQALSEFKGIKRRMQCIYNGNDIQVFDDFAHHPTAIETTLNAARSAYPGQRLIAVLDPASNTMKSGVHQHTLADALSAADLCFVHQHKGMQWRADERIDNAHIIEGVDDLLAALMATMTSNDCVVLMSNGSFGGMAEKLKRALTEQGHLQEAKQ